MLDEINEAVLNHILNECDGKYKIFEECDFYEFANEQEVDERLKFLSESGYILLRYSARGEYMLAPSQSGKAYFSQKIQNLTSRAVLSEILYKRAFKGAFLGVFFANALIAVILCILLLIRGYYAY